MECPYCGKEMTAGFVQGARVVYFTEEEHAVFFVPGRKDIKLTRDNFFAPTCEAYQCPDCRMVIIPYGAGKERP